MFSIPWSIGGVLETDSRMKFNEFFKNLLLGQNEEFPIPKSIGRVDCFFPDRDTVYDFMYEVTARGLCALHAD